MDGVTVVEVSPRDGLQNEQVPVSTAAKVQLVERLVHAGARRVEAVSFASPKAVPTMADAEDVMARVPRTPGVSYAGLVLNRRGLQRAFDAGVDEVNVVVVVSDTFSRRNQNVSSAEALSAAADVVSGARDAGLVTTVTLAAAFGCPFEGEVEHARVVDFARLAADTGAHEVCLADTIGVGVPSQVTAFDDGVRSTVGTDVVLRYHFHNTRGTGLANALAAVQDGVTVLDASAGGIGGCPFAPAATGNVPTEDLVYMLERMGIRTGYGLDALLETAGFLSDELGHQVPAMLPRAGLFPPV